MNKNKSKLFNVVIFLVLLFVIGCSNINQESQNKNIPRIKNQDIIKNNTKNLFDNEYLNKIIPKKLNSNFQRGIILGGMLWRPSDLRYIEFNIDQIKKWGADYIIIIPDWFVDNMSSNEIKPIYAKDGKFPNPTGWITPSLTDEEIIDIIRLSKKNGLKVVLKPHVDPINFGMKEGSSRGSLRPKSWDKWFNSYSKFIEHFAKLAEDENVDLFIIGTELDTATMSSLSDCCGAPKNATEEWRKIIKKIRKIYHNPITYSVSCHIDDYKKDWKTQCHGPRDIKFWDDLDYIGFEPYFGLTIKKDPSIEELTSLFDKRFKEWAMPLYTKYNKPIILTEVGFGSSDGINERVNSQLSNKVDHKEQADIYEALFESISKTNYIIGTYFWAWYIQPDNTNIQDWAEWQKNDIYDPFNGKLAGQVLKKWYKFNNN